MSQSSISVVIPTFNNGRFLPQAIETVLAQTIATREIIVVDDGSTDDTRERVIPYLGRITYIPQENRGPSAARNRGVEAATGEFIAFLDADDVWHPRKLEIQLRAMAGNPDLALLATGTFAWPATGFPAVDHRPGAAIDLVSWSQLVVRTSLLTSSVLVRHVTLDRVGPFDDSLKGPEDRDLFLRIAEIAPVARMDLPLTGYRNAPGSLSKQVVTCEAGMRKILSKLDERNAWEGRRALRRKSYSYMYHTCSHLHGARRDYTTALLYLMKSFAWYPLPYRRDEVTSRWERPKRLAVNVLRMLRMKPAAPLPQGTLLETTFDAANPMADRLAAERSSTDLRGDSTEVETALFPGRGDTLHAPR